MVGATAISLIDMSTYGQTYTKYFEYFDELFDGELPILPGEPFDYPVGYRLCARPTQRAFPYERHPPSLPLQKSNVPLVTRNCLAKFS
jgi:hypothetical protein